MSEPGKKEVATNAHLGSLAEAERRHILEVLVALRGNIKRAARILEIDRRTLYRKLHAYGFVFSRPERVGGCQQGQAGGG